MQEIISPIWGTVMDVSSRHDLDPVLVFALIEQESNYQTQAMRFEPGYRWLWPKPSEVKAPFGVSLATERNQQATSWGLMQVMGAVAREHGCGLPYLSSLCNPGLGIEYGCKHLAKLKRRWPAKCDYISAYNAGHPTMKNKQYVASVLARSERLRAWLEST